MCGSERLRRRAKLPIEGADPSYAPFVYRLGRQPFTLQRRVRFPQGAPPLTTDFRTVEPSPNFGGWSMRRFMHKLPTTFPQGFPQVPCGLDHPLGRYTSE